MSKKYMKRGLLSAALALAGFGSSSAFAVGDLPVFDALNYTANAVTAGSTAWTAAYTTWIYYKLDDINRSITQTGDGTLLGTTENIYNKTDNIDKSVTNIDESVTHIDESTTKILNYEQKNFDINKEFNYITNNYYGTGDGGIIPTNVDEGLAVMLDSANVKGYTDKYKDAMSYKDNMADATNLTDVGVQGTVMQKTANDALVNTLSSQRDSLKQQAVDLKRLAEDSVSPEAEGHGKQLQYANALAGTQAAQMMQIREMMLASENARAASAQADADRKSRQVAASQSLRDGLSGGQGSISISGIGGTSNATSVKY